MLPPWILPGGGTSRISDSAVTDLPLPDSPTRHNVSPDATVKLTLFTAGAKRPPMSKPAVRPLTESSSDVNLFVFTKDGAHRVGDLSQSGACFDSGDDRRDEIAAVARCRRDAVDRALPLSLAAAAANGAHALDLTRFDFRIDPQQLDRPVAGGRVLIDADHDRLAGIDAPLRLIGGLLDLALDDALLDCRQRPAERIDALEQRARLGFDRIRQPFQL